MTDDRRMFLVFSSPVAGQEAAYQAWYEQHLSEILALGPIVSAQRCEVEPTEGRPGPERRFLVQYEVEGSAEQALKVLRAAVADGRLGSPDPACVETPLDSFFVRRLGPLRRR